MYSLSVLHALLELLPPPLPMSPVGADWSGRCEAYWWGFRVGDTARQRDETHPEHTQTLTAEVKTISVA